jgi:hypothetical protein
VRAIFEDLRNLRRPDAIFELVGLRAGLRCRGKLNARARRITKLFVDFYEALRINSR